MENRGHPNHRSLSLLNRQVDNSTHDVYPSAFFNISSYQYNIITNRQKLNNVSMPKLVAVEKQANKLKTFLQYWNNENFFDPIRNSKDKFENVKAPLVRKMTEPESTKFAKTTSLPVIKVLKANQIRK